MHTTPHATSHRAHWVKHFTFAFQRVGVQGQTDRRPRQHAKVHPWKGPGQYLTQFACMRGVRAAVAATHCRALAVCPPRPGPVPRTTRHAPRRVLCKSAWATAGAGMCRHGMQRSRSLSVFKLRRRRYAHVAPECNRMCCSRDSGVGDAVMVAATRGSLAGGWWTRHTATR
jgi:hypothetical protein